MVVLDFSIVNVALPSIERELHMPPNAVQWIVTGYAISFGGLLILGGRAADLLGRRRMFIVGLIAFSLASLAGGLAQDPALLIAARVIQGAGAAIVAPAALSLITTSFPEGPERTRAIGLYGAISSVGFVSGQVLGGVLVEFTSWRAVFLVNVPVGLLAAALAPAILGQAAKGTRTTSNTHRLDLRGALLITSAVALIVFAVSQGVVLGWTSPLVIAAVVAAAAATAAFGMAEARHPEPLIRLSLLRRPEPAQRQHPVVPAGPVERRRDAHHVAVPAAGPARVAAVHRAGHRPAGRGRVHHGHARAAPGPPHGHQAAADPDRRRGRDRLRGAHPAARRRLQPGPARWSC